MRSATAPSLAVKNIASPKGWSQKWAHELSTTANHSEISTSKALRGLPWAQGVAGSNPVAPTTFYGHIPVTWVTVHSEDIGITFGPNGLSIRSARVTALRYADSGLARLVAAS